MTLRSCDEEVTTPSSGAIVLDAPIVALFVALLQEFSWGPCLGRARHRAGAFRQELGAAVLFRLHRSEKRCKAEKKPYHKLTEQARELVELLVKRYPQRHFELIGDAACTNASLIKARPSNLTLIGRGRLDAALYAPPPRRRRGQKGRSRVRGKRLASSAWWAARKKTRWQRLDVTVYGRSVTVRVWVIDALWYVAAGSKVVRLVVVRDFPGHEKDDVFVCTDPKLSPRHIIESFSKRWSLEVTFHEAKAKLGFADPQHRTERAVKRTAPLALVSYSLTILWFVQFGQRTRAARLPTLPWYGHKAGTTISDLLATPRRASWRERRFDPASSPSDLRKRLRPLVDDVASAA